MKSLNSETLCQICGKLFDNPIILPCEANSCSAHFKAADDLDDNKKGIKCVLCGNSHSMPIGGFPRNIFLAKAIESNIDSFNIGKKFQAAIDACLAMKRLIERFENLEEDSDLYIHDYFNEIKNKIDLHKEAQMIILEKSHDKLISQIDRIASECKSRDKNAFPRKVIDTSKCKLDKWLHYLSIPNFDLESEWKEIKLSAEQETIKIAEIYDKYRDFMLLNKEFSFQPSKIDENNFFGQLQIKENQVNHLFGRFYLILKFLNNLFCRKLMVKQMIDVRLL